VALPRCTTCPTGCSHQLSQPWDCQMSDCLQAEDLISAAEVCTRTNTCSSSSKQQKQAAAAAATEEKEEDLTVAATAVPTAAAAAAVGDVSPSVRQSVKSVSRSVKSATGSDR